jgi:hypothetical protein
VSNNIISIVSMSASAGFIAAMGLMTPSYGATTIDFTLKQNGLADTVQVSYFDAGKALIKAAGGDPNIDLLFQQSTETMTVINHADGSTLDINAEKVSALASQASGVMDLVRQQLTAQMENMSEEQREQLQKMIESMGGGQLIQPSPPASQPKSLKETGVQTINGLACNKTEVYEGGQKIAEVCTSPADVLGIPAADFAVIEAMRKMSDKLREETAKISGQMGQNLPQFGNSEVAGVPVQMKDKSGNSMTVTRIQAGIGDAVLEKPAGYITKQMPSLPQLVQ